MCQCSCLCADISCSFLITCNLYRMTYDNALRIMPLNTWKSLAIAFIEVSWFASLMFYTHCRNYLCPGTVRTLWVLFALPYRRHIPTGSFQLLPKFVHKRPGDSTLPQNDRNLNIAVLCVCHNSSSMCHSCVSWELTEDINYHVTAAT